MITYLQGNALQPVGNGPKIIAHVCNDERAFGKGFAAAVTKK